VDISRHKTMEAELQSLTLRLGRLAAERTADLKETQRAHSTLLGNLPGMAYRCRNGEERTLEFASRGCAELTGYRSTDLLGERGIPYDRLIHPEDRGRVSLEIGEAVAADRNFELVYRILTASGTEKWVWEKGSAVRGPEGEVNALEGFITDISELKHAEDALRFTQFAIDNASDSAFWMGPDARFLYVNEAACRALGYGRDELLSMSVHDIDPEFPREVWADHWNDVKQRRSFVIESRHRAKDGTVFPVEVSVNFIEFGGKEYNCAFARDISDRRRTEEALRASEAGYRALFQNVLDGVYRTTPDGRILAANSALVRILGFDSEAQLRETDITADLYVNPEERRNWAQRLEEEGEVRNVEVNLRRRDGRPIVALENARVIRDDAGRVSYFEGTLTDITDRKKLEEQLRQSQKMEAVGRLAGGVAHDFNNLLTAIKGYSELSLGRLDARDPIRKDLEEIRKAANRAEALTHQLLAMSRRQVLKPRVLDLGSVVGDLEKMLRRLIGEDIELTTVAEEPLGHVKADPGQLEQVVLNLVVNARDAMPRGGKLTIRLANTDVDEKTAGQGVDLEPGEYVTLSVEDTGCGMDVETRARIFEPFFTTKGHGKGTGLGLSTVYGIVRQSGGHTQVESEPGCGTSFRIFLPRVSERLDPAATREATDRMPGGTETILVVEDEEAVRTLVCEVLGKHGYRVLEARNGGEAIAVCEDHEGEIDLLLTDVVMPEMDGQSLRRHLAPARPGMKVLFMSGYTDDAIEEHGLLSPETSLLQKPFTLGSLLAKVREILETDPAG
jgi:PAS domain S-box-containing protein